MPNSVSCRIALNAQAAKPSGPTAVKQHARRRRLDHGLPVDQHDLAQVCARSPDGTALGHCLVSARFDPNCALSEKEACTRTRTRTRPKIKNLRSSLQHMKRDPEQEVRGIALPVLGAVIEFARSALPDDSVVAEIRDIVSAEQIASGDPIRAVDALSRC